MSSMWRTMLLLGGAVAVATAFTLRGRTDVALPKKGETTPTPGKVVEVVAPEVVPGGGVQTPGKHTIIVTPDRYGKCPDGYSFDQDGNCREVW